VAGASLPSPYAERVLDVVARIPAGRALAYGDVAELMGGRGARAVGGVLARHGSGVPWWRVVRADGSLPAGHEQEAARRLQAEGVPLRGGRVDLARCRWDASGLSDRAAGMGA
jgi:alkylated DNA nucleotide flippase Atl1